jgi:hypothetical protein
VGGALSSAILYFAIVAIWAGILMPRWLRPSAHRHRAEEAAAPEAAAPEALATFAQPGLEAQDREHTEAWSAETAAARRANILRARRRMLTTLMVLTLGAFGIAVTHVAAWWVVVPPGVLLAGFLLLLREAARSDAARAHRHAHDAQASRPRRERPAARPDEPPDEWQVFERIASTPEAPQPEAEPSPSAEIIDISARVSDQVYDQYTDAAERAVGD